MAKRKKFEDHPEIFVPPVEDKLWQTEGLFSDYYLRAKLNKNDWWPQDDEVKSHYESVRDLYTRGKKYLGGRNEALCRQELIHPVLEQLGFARIDNQSPPEEATEPDAILFSNQAEKEAVLDKDLATQYRAAITLLEAKSFKHPLSQISKSQKRYPHQQIRDYLQTSVVQRWGILTNGQEWRLYCRDTKPKDYFSLDLEIAIQSLEKFKTFAALFSPAAFQRDAQGKCRLDYIREQALSSQSELEDNLRKRVFTILADLANGFAKRPENEITDTPENLKSLYENCLIYLYRLLFILYAEGRKLLPVESESRKYYKNLSIARLVPSLRNFSDYEDQYLTKLGDSIIDLYHLINGTNERMNRDYKVPRYNGGLFDPEKYELLDTWKIADADLANVLRGLMFNPPPDRNKPNLPLQTVDYSDLRVQHLGSIYEGLLEYHLVRNGQGRLELKTDKAERKATGTYYTPDYIVKYIVEQTVKPLLEEIEQSKSARSAKPNHPNDEFAEAVLALNICDPAMGSGHFLVEATISLADQIVTHPTTRQHTEKAKDEEEIAYWRRRVVESCIYGVDLNPLAVELAKLSLWLTCISSEQPLNFLDHHLRVGNSLIGARLDQLANLPDVKGKKKPEQKEDLFFKADLQKEIAATISGIMKIERESSDNVEAVKNKEQRWLAEILPHLAPYKNIANLWTGAFFGEMTDKQAYIETVQKILKKPKKEYPLHSKHFFHWELEFPAVFFNEDGTPKDNPGFEAVVGNPPYLRNQNLLVIERNYYSESYNSATGVFDIYALFIELAVRLLRSGNLSGMIHPHKFIETHYGRGLRKLIREKASIYAFIDFGDEQVFPDAITYACIMILKKGDIRKLPNYSKITASQDALDKVKLQQLPISVLEAEPWNIRNTEALDILNKIDNKELTYPIKEICRPHYSLFTGLNEAFIVTDLMAESENLEKQLLRPLLKGEDINYWHVNYNNLLIIYPYTCDSNNQLIPVNIDKFPFIKAHLEKYKERLINRIKFINKFEDLKTREQRWFEFIDSRHPKQFKDAKLLVPEIASFNCFMEDTDGFFCINKIFTLNLDVDDNTRKYILSCLNSSLLDFYFKRIGKQLQNKYYEYASSYVARIPIRRISFTTPMSNRARLLKEAQKLYTVAIPTGDFNELLAFTATQLSAQPEHSDVVHDLLAFLAESMIALNKEKHDAARGFFTDLKDFHRIEAHTLKPKTLLDEFWRLETQEVFEHFKKNHKVLGAAGVDLGGETKDDIRTRFEKAKSAILPLAQQIAFTDRLIDQIVYKLYGLTEEEIRMVESR